MLTHTQADPVQKSCAKWDKTQYHVHIQPSSHEAHKDKWESSDTFGVVFLRVNSCTCDWTGSQSYLLTEKLQYLHVVSAQRLICLALYAPIFRRWWWSCRDSGGFAQKYVPQFVTHNPHSLCKRVMPRRINNTELCRFPYSTYMHLEHIDRVVYLINVNENMKDLTDLCGECIA